MLYCFVPVKNVCSNSVSKYRPDLIKYQMNQTFKALVTLCKHFSNVSGFSIDNLVFNDLQLNHLNRKHVMWNSYFDSILIVYLLFEGSGNTITI